jgi:hypothetical protein
VICLLLQFQFQHLLLQFRFQRILRYYETNLLIFFEKHQIVITINYIKQYFKFEFYTFNIDNMCMNTWLDFFLLKISICIIIVSFFNICTFSFLSPIMLFPLLVMESIISSAIKFSLVQTFVSHDFYSNL